MRLHWAETDDASHEHCKVDNQNSILLSSCCRGLNYMKWQLRLASMIIIRLRLLVPNHGLNILQALLKWTCVCIHNLHVHESTCSHLLPWSLVQTLPMVLRVLFPMYLQQASRKVSSSLPHSSRNLCWNMKMVTKNSAYNYSYSNHRKSGVSLVWVNSCNWYDNCCSCFDRYKYVRWNQLWAPY